MDLCQNYGDEDWRRQQKYVIRPQDDWTKDKEIIERYVEEL